MSLFTRLRRRAWQLARAAKGACAVAGLLLTAAAVMHAAQAKQAGQNAPTRSGPKELTEFSKRVDEFAALHKKLENTQQKLPKEATPEQIDKNQRALAALITSSRAGAQQGDVFTAPGQVYVRNLLKRIFANYDRRKLRESIEDENPAPGTVKLAVNGRYPDNVPLASMPPEVLQALPPLPEEIEYRFVGDALILLDPHAHIVIDFIPNALPK
jgi:hypothetical protein